MAKREDRIREAASLQVKIGQLQRYCELMVELGEVNLRTLKRALHRTRDRKRKAICFMLAKPGCFLFVSLKQDKSTFYFLRIYLSKGQVRFTTYLSTDQNHLSGASGHRFCHTLHYYSTCMTIFCKVLDESIVKQFFFDFCED